MSPGSEFDHNTMLLTQTSQSDYEDLCRLDILGLADAPEHDQGVVHAEFKEQLERSPEGWYETGLPWRGNHPFLPANKQGSLRRLSTLIKKLERNNLTDDYGGIIREQLETNIIETAPEEVKGREFYIPHKPVIRHNAASTKLRVVYDASARASPNAPSLNECLNPGPALQNKLWDVLVRQRFFAVAIFGDIQKAFLQIRIKEQERDALRFHWRVNEDSDLETYRFTRALFELACSPFLLGGVIEQHMDSWKDAMPEMIESLRKSLYVDDLLSGGLTLEKARERKNCAIEIFSDAKFTLHKWSSNMTELEDSRDTEEVSNELTFAKQQLGAQPTDSKVLGLPWDKTTDTLTVPFPQGETPSTKREVLKQLAKIYDPLGLVTPLTLQGKMIYRDICNQKLPWDAELSRPLMERVIKWQNTLPTGETVPRPVVNHREPVLELELHAFGDASTHGVGATVYAVVRQQAGTTQRLVAAKGRLAKQGLTVPRLELISAHMATNLVTNVRNTLDGLPTPTVYAWLDSTVALHWICGNGQYKQFVANRVNKIHQRPEIQWRHVPTQDNPADLGSRGGKTTELWWKGPEWLSDREKWPPNPVISASAASEEEAKMIREVLNTTLTKEVPDDMDRLLEKYNLRQALRIGTWIARFAHNCRSHIKLSGPLSTAEIEAVTKQWICRVQKRDRLTPHYEQTQRELNLQVNHEGLVECRGRIQGMYPIYLPSGALFTKKLVQKVHYETLHGGVGLTMAAVREKYWVPKLRSLVKSVRKDCWGCKRFQATALTAPPRGLLPSDRTRGETAFEVVGIDFAGPIRYRQTANREGKAYLALFACSLTRAVHLELVPNLETESFIPCLKRFIARRGRPRKIYSDNGKTFIKAAKWLRQLRQDERLHGLLEKYDIVWQFNLSRAPWWGGQFERLIGVVKSAMYKVIGGGVLKWAELSEVLLDVETQINRRPLSYVEDDIELPILTPSTFLFQRTNQLPDEETWRIKDQGLRRRAKYLNTCKDNLWNRWQREYVAALRERHNLTHKVTTFQPKIGDVVIVKTETKNRGTWPLATVKQVYPGKDGVIRAVQLKAAHSVLDRPIQHLYPLELSCDRAADTPTCTPTANLNPSAPLFRPRTRRDAAVAARATIQDLAEYEP